MCALFCSFLNKLSSDQSKHVLATAQEPLPGGIIDTSLGLVETLKRILLTISSTVAGMRLQE